MFETLVQSLPLRVKRRGREAVRAALAAGSSLVANPQQRRFVVAHLGRSGSTVLGDMLAQHPDIAYGGEVYGKHLYRVERDRGSDEWQRVDLLRVIKDELLLQRAAPWFGFDYVRQSIAVTGTNVATHARELQDLGFRPVLLRRQNHLARIVSMRSAVESRLWDSRRLGGAVGPVPVHIPVGVREDEEPQLVRRIQNAEDFFTTIRRTLGCSDLLELVYEDDIQGDPLIGYGRVIRHLGLQPADPTVRLQRLGTRPLRERIENFDEVEGALRGTPHEWMLNT